MQEKRMSDDLIGRQNGEPMDLIERQATIDAIINLTNCTSVRELYEYTQEHNLADMWCGGVNDAIDAVIAVPFTQSEQQWIPVTERLPEDGTWNIFSDGETISVERYKMDAIDHFFPQGRWFSFDEAVAWMPLPEPYGERRTDE